MDLQLEGKAAVVTGASKGIGLATVQRLVAEGASVVAAARTTSAQLAETGALVVNVDLTEPDAPASLVAEAENAYGNVDVLINNVGGGDLEQGAPAGGFLSIDDHQWEAIINLNLFAALRTTRAALPGLLSTGGTVINISSVNARVPGAGSIPYSAAKAALNSLTKSLAEEFGPQGVKIKTVSPGPVRSAIWSAPDGYGASIANAMGITLEQLVESLPGQLNMTTGRMVEPTEVAGLIAFLASPFADSIIGTDYAIDGGVLKAV